MKKSIFFFVIGFACGALVLDILCIKAVPVYTDAIKYNFLAEQELLARRAQREGNDMRALVHRWNAVDAISENGFDVFQPEWKSKNKPGLLYPFQSLCIKCGSSGEKTLRLNEGLHRARLALAMRKVGMEEPAKEQWDKALELTSWQTDKLKEVLLKFDEADNSK